jgi:predicted nucleic acid-binding protein
MSDKIFVDTNILVYSVSNDKDKKGIAENILLNFDVVISPQVIGEFVAVTIRKKILDSSKVVVYAKNFMQVLNVTVITARTVSLALDIMTKYKYSYWDSLILSAALENSCSFLYSEDLQDGQKVENTLIIQNPFK